MLSTSIRISSNSYSRGGRVMNEYFNFNRFGKFLTYELNHAKASCGLSLLILGLIPAILLSSYEIFSFIFTGNFGQIGMEVKRVAFSLCLIVLVMSLPAKLYGRLTEKKKGSDWLMVPASGLEKFLSMVLIVCVVLPVCFGVLYCCSDLLLSAIFSWAYGDSHALSIVSSFSKLSGNLADLGPDSPIYFNTSGWNIFWILYGSLCLNALAFTLGAICFKRGKVGKTILCYFVLSILFSGILVAIFGHGGSLNGDDLEAFFENLTPKRAQHVINSIINIPFIVLSAGLLTGLYFRIKTIKH